MKNIVERRNMYKVRHELTVFVQWNVLLPALEVLEEGYLNYTCMIRFYLKSYGSVKIQVQNCPIKFTAVMLMKAY